MVAYTVAAKTHLKLILIFNNSVVQVHLILHKYAAQNTAGVL